MKVRKLNLGLSLAVICLSMAAVRSLYSFDVGVTTEQTNNPWIRDNNLVSHVETPLRQPVGYERVTLPQLQSNPLYYVGRKVRVPLYFARIGEHYRPFHTKYHPNAYVNFYAWPQDIQLWSPDERQKVAFTFYVDRDNVKTVTVLDRLTAVPYAPIFVYGEVTNEHADLPWITVDTITLADAPIHSRAALSQIELGIDQVTRAGATRYDARSYIIAVDAFESAIAMGLPQASEAFVYRMLGMTYLKMREYNKAADALTKSVERNVNDVETLLNLSKVQMRLALTAGYSRERKEIVEKGLKVSTILVSEYPALAEGRAVHGLGFALAENWDAATRELNKARGLSPKMPEAAANMARMFRLRAESRKREGDMKSYRDFLERANVQFSDASELKSEEPDYHFERGQVLILLSEFDKKQLSEARTRFDAYAGLLSTRPEGYYYMGLVDRMRGQPAEAIKSLDIAISKDKKYAPAYITKADILYFDLQDPKTAEMVYLEARDEMDATPELYAGMIELGRKMNNVKLQSLGADRLIKLLPDSLPVRIAAGQVYYERSVLKQDKLLALEQFEQVMRIAKSLDQEPPAEAFLLAGRILVSYKKDYKLAEQYLKRGLAQTDDVLGRLDLAIASMHLGRDSNEAQNAARNALARAKFNDQPKLAAQAESTLALILYLNNLEKDLDDSVSKLEMETAVQSINSAWAFVKDGAMSETPLMADVGRVYALVNLRMKTLDDATLQMLVSALEKTTTADGADFLAQYALGEILYQQALKSGKARDARVAVTRLTTARDVAKSFEHVSDIARVIRSKCASLLGEAEDLSDDIQNGKWVSPTSVTVADTTEPADATTTDPTTVKTPADPVDTTPDTTDPRRRRR
ncbi:MAG: hypothetical protein ABIH86_02030 [Planctomycetota bacterium]